MQGLLLCNKINTIFNRKLFTILEMREEPQKTNAAFAKQKIGAKFNTFHQMLTKAKLLNFYSLDNIAIIIIKTLLI